AGEGTATTRAVGGLADVQLVYCGNGPQRAGSPTVARLAAALTGTQLPHSYPCVGERIARRRLMRIGGSLGELRLEPRHLRMQPGDLLTQDRRQHGLRRAARTRVDPLTCAHGLSRFPLLHLSEGKGQQQAPSSLTTVYR